MISEFMGIEYGNGACATPPGFGGPALAPAEVKKMFPDAKWTMVSPTPVDIATCIADRFAENTPVQQSIYDNTPRARHILVGGDHSVNFGHFSAIADRMSGADLCLVYVDAHFDIHSPESSRVQASGAPHGCNVRGLLGTGDLRWIKIPKHAPLLKPENVFYIGVRSFEPAEMEFVANQNIFVRHADQLQTMSAVQETVANVRNKIGNRPFVLSFDFDSIDPKFFPDVLVPENNGLSVDAARYILNAFRDAYNFEFVEYAPSGDSESASIVREFISIAMNS